MTPKWFLLQLLAILPFSLAEIVVHTCELEHKFDVNADVKNTSTVTELILSHCTLDELEHFTNLETLKLNFLYTDLIFSGTFHKLTTLEVHSGQFRIDPSFVEKVPNLKTLSLEDVDVASIESGTFWGLPQLELFSVKDSRLSQIESHAVNLELQTTSRFEVVDSRLEQLLENAFLVRSSAAVIRNNSIHFARKQSLELDTNELVFQDNRLEHAEEHALEFHSSKIVLDNNQWVAAHPHALSSVRIRPDENSFFSLRNNTFDSITSIDIDFRQLNAVDPKHLNSILRISGNTLPCSCNFPSALDGSKFVEVSRQIYYDKLTSTSFCYNRNSTLRDMIVHECLPPHPAASTQRTPLVDSGILHQRSYPHPDYDELPATSTDQVHVARKPALDPKLIHDDHDIDHKDHDIDHKDHDIDHKDHGMDHKDLTDHKDNSHVIGPVVVVVIAILVLIGILVLIFCTHRTFFTSRNDELNV